MSLALLPALGRLFSVTGAPHPLQASGTVTATTTLTAPGGVAATAAGTITATTPPAAGTVTATTTLTTPAGTATPLIAPQPTAIPAAPPPANPLSLDYLTQAAPAALGLFSGLFLILSLAVLAGGAYVYFMWRNRWRRANKLNYKVAGQWGTIAMSLGAAGIIFVLFRLMGLDGLNARFWLYLVLLIMIGFAIYAIYFFRVQYPARLAAYNQTRKVRTPTRAPAARTSQARPASPAPTREPGAPGNPRGTSTRGERRRTKKR